MTAPLRKLAYLTGEYPRASDTFIQREVMALRKIGHDVLTCSIRRTGPEHHVGPEQIAEAASTFKVLDAAKSPIRLLKAHLSCLRRPARYASALALAWRTAPKGVRGHAYQLFYFAEAAVLAHHLRANGVQHVHNHIAKASCTVAMLASALSGIPFSFTIHGPDIFFEPMQWRIDEKAKRAAFVACISNFCRSQLMCFAATETWDKLHIVHCGIAPERYGTGDRNGKHVLFVGRLARVKGVEVLLKAISDLATAHPDLNVTIIGDGPDRATLEQRARDCPVPITFTGYQSQETVASTLRETDLFVLPSFAEGVPVVLMEAMASKVPVVTTQIAGVPELVENGVSGRLVPPGDAIALQEAIDALLSDPDLRQRMGDAGRAQVESAFNIYTEAQKLSDLFQRYEGAQT